MWEGGMGHYTLSLEEHPQDVQGYEGLKAGV